MVGGERGGWAAVGAEQLVGGPGLPRHAADEACGGRGDGVAVEVEGGVVGVEVGPAQDGAGAGGAVVAGAVAFLVGADVDGAADVEVAGAAGGDDDALDAGFGLGDGGLRRVLPAAAEHVRVFGGVFEHEHELDVEVVAGAAAGVALAFFERVVDGSVLGAEFSVDLLAADGQGALLGVEGGGVFREQQAWPFAAVGQQHAGQWRIAVVLGVAVQEFVVGARAVELVVSGACHDVHVAIAAVAFEAGVDAVDGGDVGHAVVVHGGVHVPHAEGVQGRVVVAAGLVVGADLDGQVGVVSGLHARWRVAVRVFGEFHAVHLAVLVGGEVAGDVAVFALGAVVLEAHALGGVGVHLGDELGGVGEGHDLLRVRHDGSFLFIG